MVVMLCLFIVLVSDLLFKVFPVWMTLLPEEPCVIIRSLQSLLQVDLQ